MNVFYLSMYVLTKNLPINLNSHFGRVTLRIYFNPRLNFLQIAPLLVSPRLVASSPKSSLNPRNPSSQCIQPSVDILVTAVNLVDIINNTGAFCRKSRNKQ